MLPARPWSSMRKKKDSDASTPASESPPPSGDANSKDTPSEQCEHMDSIRIERIKRKILNPSMWSCSDCGTTEGVWACLTCGKTGCGRYQSEHALAHYADQQHPLALEINLKYCYCYKCDHYVTNDNKKEDIEALRKLLDNAQYVDETLSTTRSGRIIRQPQKILSTPEEFNEDDRLSTAVKHWQLRTCSNVLRRWHEFMIESREAKKPKEVLGSPRFTRSSTVVLSNGRVGLTQSQTANLNTNFKNGSIIPGITGLRNLGNTCFMNTVLQALSNTADFCDFFIHILGVPSAEGLPPPSVTLNGKIYVRRATLDCFQEATHHVPKLEEVSLTMQLHTLLRVIWSGKWAVATPWALLESVWRFVPKFRNRQQQDAQEFLCYLFDRLQLELQTHTNETAAQAEESKKSSTPRTTRSSSRRKSVDKDENDSNKENADANSPLKAPLRPNSDQPTIITEIFQGKLLSEIVCPHCKHKSTKIDPFFDLSVDIPVVSLAKPTRRRRRILNIGPSTSSRSTKTDKNKSDTTDTSKKRKRGKDDAEEDEHAGAKKKLKSETEDTKTPATTTATAGGGAKHSSDDDDEELKQETCKLEDCLFSFVKPEVLEGYVCDNCHTTTEVTRRLYLQSLPRVLCVVLKRFCWTSVSRAKIGTNVKFPFVLDVKEYVATGVNHTDYNLTSIVMHHGTGLLSGHYTSYCYNKLQNVWVHYNDSRVVFVTKEEIEREAPSNAYLLFYERCNNSTSNPLSTPPNDFKLSTSLSSYTFSPTASPRK